MPDEWIDRVFAVMALAPWHTFQVLTKRADRMRAYMDRASGRIADRTIELRRTGLAVARGMGPSAVTPLPHIRPGAPWWPLANVWLGVSAEDQERAEDRIAQLLATPAAIRFLSAEPLLGPLNLKRLHGSRDIEGGGDEHWWESCLNGKRFSIWAERDVPAPKLDWVIVGGESGPGARPMHPDWARQIRDDCAAAGVAFHFKQWGEWRWDRCDGVRQFETDMPCDCAAAGLEIRPAPPAAAGYPVTYVRTGKQRNGRHLGGRTHDDMPAVR